MVLRSQEQITQRAQHSGKLLSPTMNLGVLKHQATYSYNRHCFHLCSTFCLNSLGVHTLCRGDRSNIAKRKAQSTRFNRLTVVQKQLDVSTPDAHQGSQALLAVNNFTSPHLLSCRFCFFRRLDIGMYQISIPEFSPH